MAWCTVLRSRELRKLDNELAKKLDELKGTLNSIAWTILNKALKANVDKQVLVNNQLLTHRKKLKNLTRNKALPLTHHETVTNYLSSHRSETKEVELLKNGLGFSIKPPKLIPSDIVATFERIHWSLNVKLRNSEDHTLLRNEFGTFGTKLCLVI